MIDYSQFRSPEFRKCSCCQETKPISEFGRQRSSMSRNNPLGLHPNCRVCANQKARQYYKNGGDARRLQTQENRRRWVEKNPERHREFYIYYRQLQRQAENAPGADKGITPYKMWEIYKGICQLCLGECSPQEATIDHKIPVTRKGPHTWANTQLAHRSCNSAKGARVCEEHESAGVQPDPETDQLGKDDVGDDVNSTVVVSTGSDTVSDSSST